MVKGRRGAFWSCSRTSVAAIAVSTVIAGAVASCKRTPPEQTAAAADASAADAGVLATSIAAPSSAFVDASLPPDAPFQGTLSIASQLVDSTEVQSSEVELTVVPPAVRWDVGPAGSSTGYRVYRADQHAFYTVREADHVVLVTDEASALGATPRDGGADAGTPGRWTFRPLAAKIGRVQDYPCERWETSRDQERFEMCVAKGLVPMPLQILGGSFATTLPFNGDLETRGLFPLTAMLFDRRRTDVGAGAATGMIARYQVTRIDRRRVDPARVAIPDYRRVPTVSLPPITPPSQPH